MKQISILGCGWLGFPLAEALIKKGFEVKGTTTSPDKISLLENVGILASLIALNSDGITGNMSGFLENSEVLIIDIPPKLRNPENESFVEKIKTLLPFIEKSSIKNVIFISSTSVYSDELPIQIITENSKNNPETESGKQLLEVENLLMSNSNFETSIIRFSGLIGKNRHPINSLSGKKNIDFPDAPINLIHQEDCIGIILKLIEKGSWNQIYNAASPFHPSRKEYYHQKATALDLALPEFNESNPSKGKIISSDKLIQTLDYDFKIPNL